MFPGSPAPLRSSTSLFSVLRLAEPGVRLGAWLKGCRRLLLLSSPGGRRLVVGPDLGVLLRRCDQVVVRDGEAAVALPASLLIGWRVLEVILGTPYLPPPSQLHALFPRHRVVPGGLVIPIGLGSAEEALAVCARDRLPVVSTRIVYQGRSG